MLYNKLMTNTALEFDLTSSTPYRLESLAASCVAVVLSGSFDDTPQLLNSYDLYYACRMHEFEH